MQINSDLIYPIGSIYMNTTDLNPNEVFGGTWIQLKDRFLLGTGDTYSNGETGGEATHTLTVNEMPSHNHTQLYDQTSGSKWGIYGKISNQYGYSGPDRFLKPAGGGQPHNNMPPYLVVYMWKRTA